MLTTVFIIIACIALEAFFSGSEMAIVSADRMHLRHLAAQGSRGARMALAMLDKPEWLLSTTLIGTNIAVVTTTTLTTGLVIDLLGEAYSWVAIVVAAPLVWIFGEIVAKSSFQQRANTITPKAIYPLRAFSFLFFPLLLIFSGLTRMLARLFGGKGEHRNPFTLREEISQMIEMSSAADTDLRPIEQRMIRRVFDFTETTARDIIVPLIDVTAVERGSTVEHAKRLAVRGQHSALPVYDGRVDQICGVIDVLDLLRVPPKTPIESFVRPVPYAPGSKSIERVLVDLREGKHEMVVIVDEFGGAKGILTVEDVVEQVVGELEDEHDTATPAQVRKVTDGEYLVNARIELEAARRELGLELPDGKYETLGGFVLELIGDIPDEGTRVTFRQYAFTVEKASPVTILELRVRT